MLEATHIAGKGGFGLRGVTMPWQTTFFVGVPVQWGAICAGVMAGLSLQLVLMLLGMLTRQMSAVIVPGAREHAMGSLLWNGYSMLVAAYVSAYVAVRLSGLKRKMDGILHGVVTAAAAILLSLLVAPTVGEPLLNAISRGIVPNAWQQNMQSAIPTLSPFLRGASGSNDLSAPMTQALDVTAGMPAAGEKEGKASRNTFMDDGVEAVPLETPATAPGPAAESLAPQYFATEERVSDVLQFTSWILVAVLMLSLIFGGTGGLIGVLSMQRHPWISAASGNR